MTVSMRVMSAGRGYEYLLRSVVAGDGNRSLASPMTRYYAEAGTPPGRWMGSGVGVLGVGQLLVGSEVSESQLALLIGMGRDPVSGEALGRAFPEYKALDERIKARVAGLDTETTVEDRANEISRIQAEEATAGSRRAVAAYDFTFSVPKSVSVLWAVSDAAAQVRFLDAHHAAVTEVLDYVEREVAATRTGFANHDGAVAQVGVVGVAAAAYDHWDSRAGDPQLHTHLIISNKIQTLLDGRWRSLDGRPMHAAVTAISAHYNAVLADRLAGEFGLQWERRDRGADRNPQWEIRGVGDDLIAEFSSRTHHIEQEKDRLIDKYIAAHGRHPSEKTIVRLRAQATLTTRPEKEIHSLAELTANWRHRADQLLDGDATHWAKGLTTGSESPLMRAEDVSPDQVRRIAAEVVATVSEKRSTWRHWTLWAEASRQTMGWRFATIVDREAIVGLVVDAAERESIALTPPDLAVSPVDFRRLDGTSVFRPRHTTVFTSAGVLAAEDRLLSRADARTAPVVPATVVESVTARAVEGQTLSHQQVDALESIATSGRQVDLLVGPAGAGKTTAMRALRAAWIVAHGRVSVVGLAPSAAAAQVLSEDLGVACDNTAKWLHEYDHGRASFRHGQLVIVDEATLAGTMTLDRLTTIAAISGAKVLLVGDGAQLQSVDAGGAFSLLAHRRTDTPELTEIHRFIHAWEQHASLGLREGDVEVIGTYAHQDRLREGTTEEMLDAAYDAWRADTRHGMASILVTEATASVHALNARARAERIVAGDTDDGRDVVLADGARASTGDLVITRRNDRTLTARGGGWVRNGDRWTVTDVRPDGSLVLRRQAHSRLAASTVLPPDYVGEHVDLGYAMTAHRAQGLTVDSAHVVVSGSTTRENLYVSMTRGRASNTAYVALDRPDESHDAPERDHVTAQTILHGVLQHSGVELSALRSIEVEHETASSIAQQAAEYETLAAAAQHDRWVALVRNSGLTSDQVGQVVSSDAFGPFASELRRVEASGYDIERLLPRIVAQHALEDAEDLAAVIRYRLARATSDGRRAGHHPRFIAGLIPAAVGPMDPEYRQALDQRERLIEGRARELADLCIAGQAGWLQRLGEPPRGIRERALWLSDVQTVAAYRDRYTVTSSHPLGSSVASEAQRRDRRQAAAAICSAQRHAVGEGAHPHAARVLDRLTI